MPEVLTRDDVATMLKIKPATVDALRRRGDLRAFALGDNRLFRFNADDVAAYVAERRGARS